MTIWRRFWPIFRTPPRGVESWVARIFRALDDEEFFIVEGSLGLALTPGVRSQVLGRRLLISLHNFGAVDIHTFKESSKQQQQQ